MLGQNPERNLEIIRQYNDNWTLQEIGDHHSVTRERVRQLVARAGVNTPDMKLRRSEYRKRQRRVTKKCDACGNDYLGMGPDRKCEDCIDNNVRIPHPRRYTDEALLDEIRRLSAECGYTAGVKDMIERGRYSHTLYYRSFGSFKNAQKLAGFEPMGLGAPGHRKRK
jgi:hypothetical protein